MEKIRDCQFAEDVLYDTEHNSWARLEGETITVGINTVLAWLAGPLLSVSFKERGARIERGNGVGGFEGPRHFDVVRSPLSGRLVAVNESLREEPKRMNRDPYGEGWFARIEADNLKAELPLLLPLASARGELERSILQMGVKCFADYPDRELYEIGTECSAVLVRLDELLSSSPRGTVVHLVSDDRTAEIEMVRWAERTGHLVEEMRREGNLTHFIVKKVREWPASRRGS